MTVRDMISQLVLYDMDAQVVDSFGDPIMYMAYAKPNKFVTSKNCVRLEPKSQVDRDEWLTDFINEAMDSDMSDYDSCLELKDQGWTLEDLREYSQDVYEFAINSGVDW